MISIDASTTKPKAQSKEIYKESQPLYGCLERKEGILFISVAWNVTVVRDRSILDAASIESRCRNGLLFQAIMRDNLKCILLIFCFLQLRNTGCRRNSHSPQGVLLTPSVLCTILCVCKTGFLTSNPGLYKLVSGFLCFSQLGKLT